MVRSEQESPVPEIGTPGLMWRGLETGPWGPYTGTKLETAETAKGNLPVPRLSSTLLVGGPQETWPMVGLGPHLATERARLETPHLPVRAPGIYPDSCTLGSVRGEAAGRLTDGRADLLYSECESPDPEAGGVERRREGEGGAAIEIHLVGGHRVRVPPGFSE